MTHIYLIAGEASGDCIAADLLAELTTRWPQARFSGIGGAEMEQQRFNSLFPMEELSLMGFAEILPHIQRLKARIKQTAEHISACQPDILITVDSPGFNFRVVQMLRKQQQHLPCLHYVAPTVWAYKPQRAAKTAALYDGLMTILPFEAPYFEKEGLNTCFVGHPIAWRHSKPANGAAFRRQYNIDKDIPLLGMMPGSRIGELKRHLPVFKKTASRLKEHIPNLQIMIPANEGKAPLIYHKTRQWPLPVTVCADPAQKREAFAACNLALAKSGTVALETVLAGIPTVTTYRANPLSVWIAKKMMRIPYVNLINIMAYFDNAPAPIPEMIQEHCNPHSLSGILLQLWQSPQAQAAQQQRCERYIEKLGMSDTHSPSYKAAEFIASYLTD